MKNTDIFLLLRLFAMPVVLILLGVILLLWPDTAAVLAATVIAWLLMAAGTGFGAAALFGASPRRLTRILACAACLLVGLALLGNPLILARNIGRFLGLLLLVEGLQNLLKASVSRAMGILTLLAGALLLAAPMTASRLVFSLCGIVLLVIGIAQLIERLRRRRLNKGNDDPNIIDAL